MPHSANTATSILLLWDKPASYKTIDSYCVYQNGNFIGHTEKSHFEVTGLMPDTSYRFFVRAKAGETLSEPSNSLEQSTRPIGKVIDVTSSPYNAAGDGATLDTAAIQAAIDDCPPDGTVLLKAGKTFLCGALFLNSNMRFIINGTLKGSTDLNHYKPLIPCRLAGITHPAFASLITAGRHDPEYGYNVENLVIGGTGTIDPQGGELEQRQEEEAVAEGREEKQLLWREQWRDGGRYSRGRAICLMNCRNVYVYGLTVYKAPSYTVHPIYSNRLTFHGLHIDSAGRWHCDGLDPSSSSNIYVLNCYFNTGDDSLVIKSGRDLDGYRIGRPTEYVFVRDCVFDEGYGGITIGSETSGGVRHIFVSDCVVRGSSKAAIRLKSGRARGGVVENVHFRNIDIQDGGACAIRMNLHYENAPGKEAAPVPPMFRYIFFEDITVRTANRAIELSGADWQYIENIHFKNCDITAKEGVRGKFCNTISFENVMLNISEGPEYDFSDSLNINHRGAPKAESGAALRRSHAEQGKRGSGKSGSSAQLER